MFKTLGIVAGVYFCTGAAFFSFWAASLIVHTVPGWEVVQGGVLFMGMCYAVAAITILHIAGNGGRK